MSVTVRAMIVDDEAPAREGLRLRLAKEPDVVVVGEFSDVQQALAAIRADPPDVLFLDIEMPGADGFALVDRLSPDRKVTVVFVTAHDRHAVRAFDVRAADYLLKPVEQERLHEAVERVREQLVSERNAAVAERVRAIVSDIEPDSSSARRGMARIPVKADGTIQFIEPSSISWIDAAGDSVRLHVGAVTHHLAKSMSEVLAMLDSRQFVRIHRSTIVNLDHVRELQPYFHGEYVVVMKSGATLKLSRSYRAELSRLLGLS